jgi:hypothetical protein
MEDEVLTEYFGTAHLIFRKCSMAVRVDVPLIRVRDNAAVMGCLLPLEERHLEDFVTLWRGRLRGSEQEDRNWDWEKKLRIFVRGELGHLAESYAVEYDRVNQGMILLMVGGYRSQVNPSRRLVYVRSLATAPWNRFGGPELSGFRSVGRALLKFAQFRSEELGFGGLVGLHSLPRAERFYRRMGMQDEGLDPGNDNLRYFEWYQERPNWWENYGVDLLSDG